MFIQPEYAAHIAESPDVFSLSQWRRHAHLRCHADPDG
jgi:hypothetical protein